LKTQISIEKKPNDKNTNSQIKLGQITVPKDFQATSKLDLIKTNNPTGAIPFQIPEIDIIMKTESTTERPWFEENTENVQVNTLSAIEDSFLNDFEILQKTSVSPIQLEIETLKQGSLVTPPSEHYHYNKDIIDENNENQDDWIELKERKPVMDILFGVAKKIIKRKIKHKRNILEKLFETL